MDALLVQQEETNKKLESLRKELLPLMTKKYNTDEELKRIDELTREESKLINDSHAINMKLLEDIGKDIDGFEEDLKAM
ncbi:MAG: hypothetical protein U0469_01025 [Candidatus Paceibacterota bacterium]